MLLITNLDDIPESRIPCGLTIGSFDGVHLGHQALLKSLRSKLPSHAILAVFTFSNHPSHHFTPHAPVPLIYPPFQKAKYLQECGVDIAIFMPFTEDFAQISYEPFFESLHERLKCTHLTLGSGATFGKGKEGNEASVRALAGRLGIQVDYLSKFMLDGTPVSSGRIRSLISEGRFVEVERCLGRPYSLMGSLQNGVMSVDGLCLPPEGFYSVRINGYFGKAHVVLQDQKIHLEFQDHSLSNIDQDVEVFF